MAKGRKQGFGVFLTGSGYFIDQVVKRVKTAAEKKHLVLKEREIRDAIVKEMNERFERVDKEIGLIRAEQCVFAKTFEFHHKRLEFLEDATSG